VAAPARRCDPSPAAPELATQPPATKGWMIAAPSPPPGLFGRGITCETRKRDAHALLTPAPAFHITNDNINNDHTRRAHARACSPVFRLVRKSRALAHGHPAVRCGRLGQRPAAATWGAGCEAAACCRAHAVRLAITGQIVPMNPAATVRAPKHVVKTGKTPVLEGDEWRKLLASIPTTNLRDLRDRALIATLTYSFARIGAALKMKVERQAHGDDAKAFADQPRIPALEIERRSDADRRQAIGNAPEIRELDARQGRILRRLIRQQRPAPVFLILFSRRDWRVWRGSWWA
jgi:hypothetical protein